MANPIQTLLFGTIRFLWSLVMLAVSLAIGYFAGQQWGESQNEPNGVWYGLLGGLVVWAIFFRRRRRRRSSRGTTYDSYQGAGDGIGSWFDGGGDDGGSDD